MTNLGACGFWSSHSLVSQVCSNRTCAPAQSLKQHMHILDSWTPGMPPRYQVWSSQKEIFKPYTRMCRTVKACVRINTYWHTYVHTRTYIPTFTHHTSLPTWHPCLNICTSMTLRTYSGIEPVTAIDFGILHCVQLLLAVDVVISKSRLLWHWCCHGTGCLCGGHLDLWPKGPAAVAGDWFSRDWWPVWPALLWF